MQFKIISPLVYFKPAGAQELNNKISIIDPINSRKKKSFLYTERKFIKRPRLTNIHVKP